MYTFTKTAKQIFLAALYIITRLKAKVDQTFQEVQFGLFGQSTEVGQIFLVATQEQYMPKIKVE